MHFATKPVRLTLTFPAGMVVTFVDKGGRTLVETVVTCASLADMETVLDVGLEQGLKTSIKNLREILLSIE
jgi:hypothetical protein